MHGYDGCTPLNSCDTHLLLAEIIDNDMRYWKAPCKADIMVSELLGSWGDNELSPGIFLVMHCFTQ